MDASFWHERWAAGQTGWHQHAIQAALQRHLDRLTNRQPSRVLVPLCGKSQDMTYLADQGHTVVGIELVEQAVQAFFAEQRSKPQIVRHPRVTRYEADKWILLQADFFAVTADDVGPVTCAYDRAALVALPHGQRSHYVRHLLELVPRGGRILLLTLSYDDSRCAGPPFSVPDAEVLGHFTNRCTIEQLETERSDDVPDRFRDAGVTEIQTSTWFLTHERP